MNFKDFFVWVLQQNVPNYILENISNNSAHKDLISSKFFLPDCF